MAYNNSVSNQDYRTSSSKKTKPVGFNKVSTTDVDINEDLGRFTNEGGAQPTARTAASSDDMAGLSQKIISEVRSQGEAVLGQLKTLAQDYGLELSELRGRAMRVAQNNPGAILLGAACVGFCAGYMAKGMMSKPAAE